MPQARDIGLGKHLKDWETKRKKEEHKKKNGKVKKGTPKTRGGKVLKTLFGRKRPKRKAGRGGWV